MDEATTEIVHQWFRKAESDLQNIRNNLVADIVPTDTICFHAQQAIEKLLKGVMVACGTNVGKTHDLVKLLSDVAGIVPELLPFEEQFEDLSEYGVAVRYPDDFFEPTLDEARHAFDVAMKVKEIVMEKMNPEFNA